MSKYEEGGIFFHLLMFLGGIIYHMRVIYEIIFLNRKSPESVPIDQCIFCNCQTREYQDSIAKQYNTNTILHRDDKCFIIQDYRPKGPVHYLVIPVKHVCSVKDILKDVNHYELIVHMKRVALDFIKQREGMKEEDTTLSFHVPPFYSVNHLHMHITSDKYDSFLKRFVFYYDTMWCINIETVEKRLLALKKKRQ